MIPKVHPIYIRIISLQIFEIDYVARSNYQLALRYNDDSRFALVSSNSILKIVALLYNIELLPVKISIPYDIMD